jgi:hypothetical protein
MPTTTGKASEFITFSRTSNATVTDSDGKIKWAPHNLLLASEQFDSASWTKSASASTIPAVTANAGVAPNGTTTADRVDYGVIDAAGDVSAVYQTFTAVDATYTASVYVKAFAAGDVGKKVWIYGYDTAFRGTTSVTLTTNWQLLTTSVNLAAGNRDFYVATLGSTYGGENQGAVSVLLWGASLYRSDLGGMKANASAYPMYNPTTVKNLVGFTQSFDNAAWTKGGLVTTGMANVTATTDPLGGNTADKLQETATTAEHYAFQSVSVGAAPHTFSVYLKAAERTWATIYLSPSAATPTWFNLAPDGSGVPGTVAAGFTAASTYVGNGWYRCSITGTTTAATWVTVVNPSLGNNISVTYAGTLNSGIYLWGAQLSDSASLDTYVPNYGAAPTAAAYYGPRLDYDPVTLAAKGLLVEEQRTNRMLYTDEFSFVGAADQIWSVQEATVTADAATSPDGTSNADFVKETTNTGAHGIYGSVTTLSSVSGAHTVSVFAKANGRTKFRLTLWSGSLPYGGGSAGGAEYDLTAKTAAAYTNGFWTGSSPVITELSNGWFRCSATVALPGSGFVYYAVTFNDGASYSYAGDVTKGLYLWGAQVEAGSFVTSYIPNKAVSAGVTRAADVASVSTQAFPYSATEGTLVANATIGNTSTQGPVAVTLNDGTGSNIIYTLQIVGTGIRRSGIIYTGAVEQALLSEALTNTVGLTTKAAFAFKVNDVAGSINGGTVLTDTSALIPTVNTMRIGDNANGSQTFNGHIRQITYLPRRISNTELQTRTA